MDVIEFIGKDVKRGSSNRTMRDIFLILGIVSATALFGLGLREGLDDSFDLRTFLPNLMAMCLLSGLMVASYRKSFSSQRVLVVASGALVVALLLSIDRVFFPPGLRTIYASQDSFWIESEKCFFKGMIATVVLGLWMTLMAFKFSAWPSRRWRGLLSVTSGIGGTVMLGFHCDSSSFAHVIFGHILQGVLAGMFIFALQEFFFRMLLKRQFSETFHAIKNPGKIG